MKSETSFFSRGIFYNNLKSLGWFPIIYFLILVFSLPFQIIIIYNSRPETQYAVMKDLFYFAADIQSILIVVTPVLLAILLFRYLQVKSSVVLIHSLPIKRGTLFITHVITGIAFLAVPIILTALLAWALRAGLALNDFYMGYDILQWIGKTLLMNILFLLAAVLVGMATGLSIAQGVLTYILLLLPAGITLLVLANLEIFLYGFIYDYTRQGAIAKLSPFVRILQQANYKMQFNEVIGYLIFAVIFLILAYFFYSRRKTEGASQTIAFNGLKPIFKYGVTLCFMLVGGLYFRGFEFSKLWVLFGYFLGSLLGYLVAEIVLKKSFRVFGNLKGYLYYISVVILLLMAVNFDFTGYENKLPPLEQVESIYYGNNYFYLKQLEAMPLEMKFDQPEVINERYLEQENLRNIRRFHQQIIADKDKFQKSSDSRYDRNTRQVMFAYKMKDGKEVVRGYHIPMENYVAFFKPIHESIEYKEMFNPILKVNSKQVDKIIIRPVGDISKRVVIIDEIQIKKAVEILQAEIKSATYEEMSDKEKNWATVELMLTNDKTVGAKWDKNYLKFESWLKLMGYWEDARIIPKDIEYALVEEIDKDNWQDFPQVTKEASVKQLKITDKKELEESLSNYLDWSAENKYAITFFSEKDIPVSSGYFDKKTVPSFAKEYFQK